MVVPDEKSGARASGGVGVISRMPGEGDVTALPLFRQGAGDSSLLLILRPFLSFFTQSIPCLRLRKVILGRISFLC